MGWIGSICVLIARIILSIALFCFIEEQYAAKEYGIRVLNEYAVSHATLVFPFFLLMEGLFALMLLFGWHIRWATTLLLIFFVGMMVLFIQPIGEQQKIWALIKEILLSEGLIIAGLLSLGAAGAGRISMDARRVCSREAATSRQSEELAELSEE